MHWRHRDDRHCGLMRLAATCPIGSGRWRNHAAEDSRWDCDLVVLCLTQCRAPGLEQEHRFRSPDRSAIHRTFGRSSNLGRPNAFRSSSMIKVKNVSRPNGALAANAFAGQTAEPDAKALEKALGPSLSLWQRLVANLK